jgi:hypothetical protein
VPCSGADRLRPVDQLHPLLLDIRSSTERRSLDTAVPSYLPEWKSRLVSKTGTISVNTRWWSSARRSGRVKDPLRSHKEPRAAHP